MIWTKRIDLADDLWRFGEDSLAKRVADENDVTAEQLVLIGKAASRYSLDERYATPAGRGMMISKALAHGAVEVLEEARVHSLETDVGRGLRLTVRATSSGVIPEHWRSRAEWLEQVAFRVDALQAKLRKWQTE